MVEAERDYGATHRSDNTKAPEAAKAMKWGGMSEEEALKLVTINPAIMLRIDDRVGSIEVGKDADMVILDRNLFDLPTNQIHETEVLQTVFRGRVVYERDGEAASTRPEMPRFLAWATAAW